MTDPSTCPACGAPLAEGSAGGMCPACLLHAAMGGDSTLHLPPGATGAEDEVPPGPPTEQSGMHTTPTTFRHPMKTLLLLASAVLSAYTPLSAGKTAGPDFFPFVTGRYWLYDGKVAFAANGKVHEKEIKGWRSEVVEVAQGPDFRAALLKGHPGDLAWFEEGRKRSDIIVIVSASGEYQEYRRDDAVRQFASIKANGRLAADMETELIFRYPPKEGERFSEENPGSKWATYCWVASAQGEEVFDPPVKGLPESKPYPQFTVIYRTSPDHTIIGFAAGVGIRAYTYVHHGTKGDCEMRLVETGVAKPEPDPQSAADAAAIDNKPQPPSTP